MIRFTRNTPTEETLQDIYKTIHKIFNSQEYYYTKSDLEKIKENPNNLIIKTKE